MRIFRRKFNYLKAEIFYVRRLLEEGYGPRYWWPYVKNAYFGNYLVKRMPACAYEPNSEIELHTICHTQGVWMLYWMVRSLIGHTGLKPVIVIHDGGLDQNAVKTIAMKLPTAKIMFYKDNAERLQGVPGLPEIIKEAGINGHFFLTKLINPVVFSRAKRLLVTDIDILYYQPPTEIIDFMNGNSQYDALVQQGPEGVSPQGVPYGSFDLMVDDYYSDKYRLKEKDIARLNGGYILVRKDKLTIDKLAEFLEHNKRPLKDYFLEMSAWACLLAQMNYKILPHNRYQIKCGVGDQTIMKHFTSPRRHEMFAYGIDKARENIGKK